MAKTPTVVIADDHPIFLLGLKSVLEKMTEDFELIGVAENGSQAWDLIKNKKPDIALLDIEMPDISGLDICEKVRSDGLFTKVIALTVHKDEDIFNQALEAGVHGYILKENSINDLSEGIKTVLSGNFFFSASVSSFLLNRTARQAAAETEVKGRRLTKTEKYVMRMIAEGHTSNEIAKKMRISVKTINNHRANICKKLNLKGTNSLLVYAMKNKENFL
ncbi:MAG: response regulator transcription factor [Bacteroidota bacterium]|nr:response regulator transcription factor [Bacteroidota bacterium]MDX5469858.1 response regulator transcription factor [Bacteroidota bacterium]